MWFTLSWKFLLKLQIYCLISERLFKYISIIKQQSGKFLCIKFLVYYILECRKKISFSMLKFDNIVSKVNTLYKASISICKCLFRRCVSRFMIERGDFNAWLEHVDPTTVCMLPYDWHKRGDFNAWLEHVTRNSWDDRDND